MTALAPPLERLIAELSKLPGIGRKTAQRLAFHLLKAPPADVSSLAAAIAALPSSLRSCSDCFNLAEEDRCPICMDGRRDPTTLCVVEDPADLLALERTGSFRGLYHVLGGALSPLQDVGPEQLHVRELLARLEGGTILEVVLATRPNVEGEATAVYLSRLIGPLGIRTTRLAQGLPAGADLEFTDDLTIQRALEGRHEF